MNDILERIFWIQSQIKLAHWQEKSGYRHLVLDQYYKDISKEFDRLVETIQGGLTTTLKITDSLFTINNDIDYEKFQIECYKFIDKLRIKFKEQNYITNILDDIDTIINRNSDLLRKK